MVQKCILSLYCSTASRQEQVQLKLDGQIPVSGQCQNPWTHTLLLFYNYTFFRFNVKNIFFTATVHNDMGMRRGNSKEAKKEISSRLRNQGTKNVASVDLYGAVENIGTMVFWNLYPAWFCLILLVIPWPLIMCQKCRDGLLTKVFAAKILNTISYL